MPRRCEKKCKTLKVCLFWVSLVLLGSILKAGCGGGASTNARNTTKLPPASSVSHTVELSWNASLSQDVQSYKLYRGSQSGGPYTFVGSTSKETRNFTDTNVQIGSTYFYVVTAVNETNVESTYSNEARADIPHP